MERLDLASDADFVVFRLIGQMIQGLLVGRERFSEFSLHEQVVSERFLGVSFRQTFGVVGDRRIRLG